ncbi:MAG TPA: ATP-dependent RecD-like DNA helicase, partial [Spirochaetota bacterium]|nr:ATP-dependent RecD-like DNA helicase [Spirochaetota bacterium]
YYGAEAVNIIKQQPYQLAEDITGIGFITADNIARETGITADDPRRLFAGTVYILKKAAADGHMYLPYEELIKQAASMLKTTREKIVAALSKLNFNNKIIFEEISTGLAEFIPNNKAVYLQQNYFYETETASFLKEIAAARFPYYFKENSRDIDAAAAKHKLELSPDQKTALVKAMHEKILILTGGPGTGKSTLIKIITELYRQKNCRVKLAAPTGRAAKRLSNVCAMEAKTIHRLLEYTPRAGGFSRNRDKQLDCDLLIIDEVSMLDIKLAYFLLRALPPAAVFILVGDKDQLPSVGAGNLLSDLITAGLFPVVELTQIFRQGKGSCITVNAHNINHGVIPQYSNQETDDFFFINQPDQNIILKLIRKMVTERIPKRHALDPLKDIQVLTPMYKGPVGADSLNRELQQIFTASGPEIRKGDAVFYHGDKIMQLKNNYDKDVYNGDIGFITAVDQNTGKIEVNFNGNQVCYQKPELDQLVPAYATTVHKSQGSEFPAVIIPVVMSHYLLLQRNMLYTAVSRGKKLVVIIGEKRALSYCIKNNRQEKRYSGLARKLAN